MATDGDMPQAKLHILAGPYRGRSIAVRHGEACRLGRTDRSDLVLDKDPYLSDMHFQLDCSGTSVRMTDLGSERGTYVNGERQLEVVIHDGDIIQAGRSQFQVAVEGESSKSEQRPPKPMRLPADEPTRPYAQGITDEDSSVRGEALYAAAWARQPWLLDYCREACAALAQADWQVMYLLAVMGHPNDLELILRLARTPEIGPRRFQLLGVFGHPGAINELLVRLESPDARTAAAAAMAFTKITGVDLASDREVEITESDDEIQSAVLDSVRLPDPREAATYWQRHQRVFLAATRWCRGFDLSGPARWEVLEALDMESRFEACLRDHFYRRRTFNPRELWSFVQPL